jgi:hypothetical protein
VSKWSETLAEDELQEGLPIDRQALDARGVPVENPSDALDQDP